MTSIAISHTWPDIKNAEYEVVQRLLNAAELISVPVIIVDRHGTILWHTDGVAAIIGQSLRKGDVDFLISLHFESPKVVDVYSYYALWQPIEFYTVFGHEKTVRGLLSHDDLLSCDSEIADAHGLNLLESVGRSVPTPLPRLYHTLPQPFLEPRIDKDARVFYVGVNWERLGRKKGRFHDALLILAEKDLVDIYGPELLLGVAPWQGFAAYQGELPFDGDAVKFALNRAGICLALSSQSHVDTGIMSNRLFEGLAGGAAVICNSNPFIAKHFTDEVYLVDSERGEEALAMQVVQIVRKIRADPEAAVAKVLRAQKIMREKFALEHNLEVIISAHREREVAYERNFLNETTVTVIVDFRGTDLATLDKFAASLRDQKKVSIDLHIFCDSDMRTFAESRVSVGGSLRVVEVVTLSSTSRPSRFDGVQPFKKKRGAAVADILTRAGTTHFAFANPCDTFFTNHFARLASVALRYNSARVAASATVVSSTSLEAKTTRQLHEAADQETLLLCARSNISDSGRFLFDIRLTKSLPLHLFALLDGAEFLFFGALSVLSGPIAQTYQPTLDKDSQIEAILPVTKRRQLEYIGDYFSFNPAWLRAAAQAKITVADAFASVFIEPVPPADNNFPLLVANKRYETSSGGDGLPFLVEGFSYAEDAFVWCHERGIIDFSLPDVRRLEGFSFIFRCVLAGRQSRTTGRPQYLTVAFNGMVIGYYSTVEADKTVSIHLPVAKLPAGNRFRLELIPDHAEPFYSNSGEIIDARLMSFRLTSFVLEQTPYYDGPRVSLGEKLILHKSGPGQSVLAQGFHRPEDDFVWIAGTRARIQFFSKDGISAGRLYFSVITRSAVSTGEKQRLSVTMNGIELGEQVLAHGEADCSFDFKMLIMESDLIDLILELAHAEAVFDEAHTIVDPRLLGLALKTMEITDFSIQGAPREASIEDDVCSDQ